MCTQLIAMHLYTPLPYNHAICQLTLRGSRVFFLFLFSFSPFFYLLKFLHAYPPSFHFVEWIEARVPNNRRWRLEMASGGGAGGGRQDCCITVILTLKKLLQWVPFRVCLVGVKIIFVKNDFSILRCLTKKEEENYFQRKMIFPHMKENIFL